MGSPWAARHAATILAMGLGSAMAETTLTELRQLFVARYEELRSKLSQKLGSIELASDALQETWLRLSSGKPSGEVHSPGNYLFRAALNAALDKRRSEKRHLNSVEIDRLIELPDETPDPVRIVEGRAAIRRLEEILAELSPRQREILLAARLDNMPRQEIADRLGISLRLVSKELRLAQEHCLARRDEATE
jgi:RNA polymerase sigma factor (sigma-70 family)